MIRELINKFNRLLSEKSVSLRRNHTAPIKIWFDPDVNTERGRELARAACVLGETSDLSRTGIAFIVPSIRVKEKYLVNQERKLNVEIDLPNGKVFMRMIGRRYEKVGLHVSTERFMIGAQILEIPAEDKEIYETFLRKGGRLKKSSANLELGID